MLGPQLPFSDRLHGMKYRSPGENFRESQNRQASALSDSDEHYTRTRDIYMDQRFLNAGRVQAGAGSMNDVTMHNCFVSGIIEDSLVEGNGCILDRLKEAAATLRMGGGIGYDFSTLRPADDKIKSQNTPASGPVSFLYPYHEVCKTIASAGMRHGAQMATMRVDHPDIEKFIFVKQNFTELRTMNLSILITDEFMECLLTQRPFNLQFGGVVYKQVDPVELWEKIMRSTWDWAARRNASPSPMVRTMAFQICSSISGDLPVTSRPKSSSLNSGKSQRSLVTEVPVSSLSGRFSRASWNTCQWFSSEVHDWLMASLIGSCVRTP